MSVTMLTRFVHLRNLMNGSSTSSAALKLTQHLGTARMMNTDTDSEALSVINSLSEPVKGAPKKKLNKAMKIYLERSREHEEFFKKETVEYEIGRRHLANMMGQDPERFNQHDINRAIKYLFPSGLYEPKALPIMKHPEILYPQRKPAEFDETGRPYHFQFYTAKPNYYQALYDIVEAMEVLNKKEDEMIQSGKLPDPQDKLDTLQSSWLPKTGIEKVLSENMSDEDYEYLIAALDKLTNHPLSATASEVIMKYRKQLQSILQGIQVLPLQYTQDGRPYVDVPSCSRKSAKGSVRILGNGSGKITINGKDIHYFNDIHHRQQIAFPLILSGMIGKVDIEAAVTGGGPTGQSGAIRWGIAWGLRSFVDLETTEKMRIAGLLTKDWRKRERKKFGQEGARRKFTWKKR